MPGTRRGYSNTPNDFCSGSPAAGWGANFVHIPVRRYMKTYGLTHEQLAVVSVVQREWAAKNPRAAIAR
jgi:acetyl-CoA acetyltransferase